MAGAGYKLFSTGDVLSASDVNTYLQQQTVMVFASAAARTTALASVLAEGMVTYLKDTDVVEIYTGAAWVSLDDPNAIQNSIVDAKGDIIAATADNTPARLAVGANNTVLTADSSTATGLKWATPATGNFTLISRTSFSNVASQAFDSVFTSTYQSYQIMIEDLYSTSTTDDLLFQLRYAGPTTQATTYYEQYQTLSNASLSSLTVANGTELILNTSTGVSGNGTSARFDIYGVSGSSAKPSGAFQTYNINNNVYTQGGFSQDTARIYTGFLLKSASTNITGTVAIYGRN